MLNPPLAKLRVFPRSGLSFPGQLEPKACPASPAHRNSPTLQREIGFPGLAQGSELLASPGLDLTSPSLLESQGLPSQPSPLQSSSSILEQISLQSEIGFPSLAQSSQSRLASSGLPLACDQLKP